MSEPVRSIPAPEPNPETQPFWDATKRGELLLRRCGGCGEAHYYPRKICPLCGSADTAWEQAAGEGTIYSFSVMRQAKIPYAIAYVTLDEGPTMMTNIVETDLDAIRIGQRVRVVFVPTEGGAPVPMFRPVGIP
jgi:uncharacterized OB-fold protein